MDLVGIRGVIETLVEELGSAMGYLAIPFHLSKPKSSITGGEREGGEERRVYYLGTLDHQWWLTVTSPP